MLDKLVAGMQLKSEDYITNLKPLLEAKKAELNKSEFANLIANIEDEKDADGDLKMSEV
jgi:hypothetical protein